MRMVGLSCGVQTRIYRWDKSVITVLVVMGVGKGVVVWFRGGCRYKVVEL